MPQYAHSRCNWIPACAGMSGVRPIRSSPQKRGPRQVLRKAMHMHRTVLVVIAILLTYGSGAARAQDAADVDAAKKEAKLVWYTSTPVETGQKIVDLFLKQYGIKVEMFR